jgi:hypothetical protein
MENFLEKDMSIKHFGILAIAVLSCGVVAQQAQATLLFADNFNAPDGQLDSASTAGRVSGLLAGTVGFQSQQVEQLLVGGQLQLQNVNYSGTTSVRFNHDYDWSTGAAGAAILAAGGMDISFDWTAPESTSGNWISYSAGIKPGTTDNAYEVVGSTNSGILLRDNGGVSSFSNGSASGVNNSFNAASLTHHVDLTYYFSSFADGSPATLVASVDGSVVATQNFAWNNNGGIIYMELASANSGSNTPLIDNFAVNTVPEPTSMGLLGLGSIAFLGRRRSAK